MNCSLLSRLSSRIKRAFGQSSPCPEAVAFLPDALEIQHQPLPWWGRSGIICISFFLTLIIIWSYIGQVDVFVTSTGKVISREPTIIMKPLERTVIKSIPIEVGEMVKQGQVLMTFDPVFSQADVQRLSNEISTLSAQFNRLKCEFEGKDFIIFDDNSDDMRWQNSIFIMRKQFYTEKNIYFDKTLASIEQSKFSLEESLKKQKQRLAMYQDIEAMLLRARSSQTASPRDLKELQISRLQTESEIVGIQSKILELTSEILIKKSEHNAFIEEWNKNVVEEMVNVRRELVKARNEYDKAVQLERYVTLYSPCDAIIHEIAPVSIGSAVREAESLVTLVPVGGDIEIEAEIAARDIGKIRIQDNVRVKLMPFPFQQYGTIDGIVRNISENTFHKQREASTNSDDIEKKMGDTFYRARITLEKPFNGMLKDIRLIPGMEVQAEIHVGKRRIITYIIHPLIKSLDESIREP